MNGHLIGFLFAFVLGFGGSFAGYWLSDRMIRHHRRKFLAEARRKVSIHVPQVLSHAELIALLDAGDLDGRLSVTITVPPSPEVKVAGKVH